MDLNIIRTLILDTAIDRHSAIVLSALLLLVPAIPFLTARIRAGRVPRLRDIAGYDMLPQYTAQSLETDRPMHVSVGVRGLTDTATAQTLAGLSALQYVAGQAAVNGTHLTVTAADPTALPIAQDVVRRAYDEWGRRSQLAMSDVRLYGPEPATYAAGVMGSVLSREAPLANVMIGALGDEYLLIGETARRKGIVQVVGTGILQALPFVYVSADHAILGEEAFAAGAYLSRFPSHVASLIAQDWMRIVIVLVILVGIVLETIR